MQWKITKIDNLYEYVCIHCGNIVKSSKPDLQVSCGCIPENIPEHLRVDPQKLMLEIESSPFGSGTASNPPVKKPCNCGGDLAEKMKKTTNPRRP